jgi:hypothetical protein
MLNSAAAAGAAERAAIDAAQPLALQEANAFGQAAGQNLEYLNQMALEGAREDRAALDRIAAMDAARTAAGNQLQLQRERLAFEGEQRGLDRQHQVYRDQWGYRYDLGRDNNRARNQRQDYAFRTRVDMNTNRQVFFNSLMRAALENPELYTPEDVAGFMATFDPYFDEMEANFDDFYFDEFGDYDFGGY